MEDLLLDSISEKLLAIDQKTTEIVKTTGEINRSIEQIRSRLSSLESIKKSTIGEIQPPQRPESKGNRPFWSLAPENNLWRILIPILIALGSMAALSFVLTAGLQTSLLLPYLQNPPEDRRTKLISPTPIMQDPNVHRKKQTKPAVTVSRRSVSHF